jgi:hypothetical protein
MWLNPAAMTGGVLASLRDWRANKDYLAFLHCLVGKITKIRKALHATCVSRHINDDSNLPVAMWLKHPHVTSHISVIIGTDVILMPSFFLLNEVE